MIEDDISNEQVLASLGSNKLLISSKDEKSCTFLREPHYYSLRPTTVLFTYSFHSKSKIDQSPFDRRLFAILTVLTTIMIIYSIGIEIEAYKPKRMSVVS